MHKKCHPTMGMTLLSWLRYVSYALYDTHVMPINPRRHPRRRHLRRRHPHRHHLVLFR